MSINIKNSMCYVNGKNDMRGYDAIVDISKMNIGYSAPYRVFFVSSVSNRVRGVENLYLAGFDTVAVDYRQLEDRQITGAESTTGFYIKDLRYTSVDEFKTAHMGDLFYFFWS